MLRINLDLEQSTKLQFEKTESLTQLATELSVETTPVYECTDVVVSSLSQPFLSGYELNCTAPLGIQEAFALQNNPYGLVKVYDPISKLYRYGWVNEWSSDPIDKKTNLRLSLCSSYITPIEKKNKLLLLSNKYLKLLNGGELLLLNQN